jgi:hypothetical protein
MKNIRKIFDLEQRIDGFLDLITESSLVFEQFTKFYVDHRNTDCEQKVQQINEKEQKADELRIQIEKYIYSNLLIPENRGDVLAILDGSDMVLDKMKEIVVDMQIEQPFIPISLHDDFLELSRLSVCCVDELTKSVRAFFYNMHEVANNVNKVMFYEKEADILAERIRWLLYKSDLALAEKNHFKSFIKEIELITDYAQAVAEKLVIYVMKREL